MRAGLLLDDLLRDRLWRMGSAGAVAQSRTTLKLAGCVLATAGAFIVVGCGGGTPSRPSTVDAAQVAQGAHRALDRWSRYPVDARPRPVITLGGRVQRPPAQNDRETRLLRTGSYLVVIKLSRASKRGNGYRLISEAQAVRKLRFLKPAKAARRPALVIDRVRLGHGRFPTDRPNTEYPEWLFYLKGIDTPTRVLATPLFRPPTPITLRQVPAALRDTPVADSAVVSDDGRRLRISFYGGAAGTGPCDVNYTAQTFSSRNAVAYAIIPHPVPSKDHICLLGAYLQDVLVTLPKPLGHRVLVGANYGNVTAVRRNVAAVRSDPGPRG